MAALYIASQFEEAGLQPISKETGYFQQVPLLGFSIALSFHTQPRYTKDIDLLLFAEDIDNLKSILKKMEYTIEANQWTFKNTNITLHRLTKIEGKIRFQ